MVTKVMAMVDTVAMATTTTLLVTMDMVLDMITVSKDMDTLLCGSMLNVFIKNVNCDGVAENVKILQLVLIY